MNTHDTNRCSSVCLAGIEEPCSRLMPVVVHVSGANGPETGREQYVGYWRPSAQTKPITPRKKILGVVVVEDADGLGDRLDLHGAGLGVAMSTEGGGARVAACRCIPKMAHRLRHEY